MSKLLERGASEHSVETFDLERYGRSRYYERLFSRVGHTIESWFMYIPNSD